MFASDQYELLDFGGGRKLERFGPHVLDRPSPAADRASRERPQLWAKATARYDRDDGQAGHWSLARPIDSAWQVNFGSLRLELKLTDSGQTGVFPEQAANWQWIAERVRQAGCIKVLNLFAYTGAATLAAASAGAEVVHVDASASAVAWARRNADQSNLGGAPIRWMIEDVVKFACRQQKRGNLYDGIILDPPAYGHGPRGQAWKLESHLDDLLATCLDLCRGEEHFVLLTCHSGRLGCASELLNDAIAREPRFGASGKLSCRDLCLISSTGRRLHCGASLRWSRNAASTRGTTPP